LALPLNSLRRDEVHLLTRPLNILVVEDDSDAGETLVALLSAIGHHAQHVADGHAAVRAVMYERCDVALIDLGLPDIDGLGLAKLMRAQRPDVCLVALTGYDDERSRELALQNGCGAFLVKPLSLESLIEALARLPLRSG
jgi:DNA-binding response OmpR family regulator